MSRDDKRLIDRERSLDRVVGFVRESYRRSHRLGAIARECVPASLHGSLTHTDTITRCPIDTHDLIARECSTCERCSDGERIGRVLDE